MGLAAALLGASCAVDFPDYPAGDITGASAIGRACTSDAQCAGGICWAEGQQFGTAEGSPVLGLCTLRCPNGDECGAGSVCHLFGGERLCVLGCLWGENNDDKCGRRQEVGCVDDTAGDRCIPIEAGTTHCRLGADCGECVVGEEPCEPPGVDDPPTCPPFSDESSAAERDWETCRP